MSMTMLRYPTMRDRLDAWSLPLIGFGGSCIIWLGAQSMNGYGKVSVRKGKPWPSWRMAHKIAWELKHGRPVKPEYQLDHTCETRLCINPDHCDEVTTGEHAARGAERRRCRAERGEIEVVEFSAAEDAEFDRIIGGG
jgi:hypothetical protein